MKWNRVVQAVCILLLLTACTSGSTSKPISASTVTPSCPEHVQPSNHPGSMYLLIGPVVGGLPLGRLNFRTGCLTLIAPQMATIETNGKQVVGDDVSTPGIPTIGEVIGSTLHPVSPSLRGTMPAVSADGRIATIHLTYPGYKLDVWNPATGKNTTLYESATLLQRPQWGPHGSILLLRGRRKRTQLVSIDEHGSPHVLLAAPDARWMDLSSHGLVDVTDYSSTTTVYNLATREQHVLHGWYGMGWDPSGSTLVLATMTGRFGFSSSPSFGSVSNVLQLPRPGFVLGMAWVSQPSTRTG